MYCKVLNYVIYLFRIIIKMKKYMLILFLITVSLATICLAIVSDGDNKKCTPSITKESNTQIVHGSFSEISLPEGKAYLIEEHFILRNP